MHNILFIVFIYLFFQMILVWVIAKKINNPSVIDVAWPIGLMLSGLIYLFSQGINLRLLIISVILIVWGARLASYLYLSRIKKGIVDKRYLMLSQDWKISQSLDYFLNFELQGLFIFIMSIVFMFAASQSRTSLNWIDFIGIALCLIGIIGESISDMQLQTFKKNNTGKVCNLGFWNYSRHPNYFFDWITWCGFACFALQSSYGWIGLISPLLLFLLMTKVTGPMTEQGSIDSRGELYLQYQRTTSMFFPWFKKK